MNSAITSATELSLDEVVLRDLLDCEIVLIGGGELIAEFH